MSTEWYVLRTKPHAEWQVSALLTMRHAEHYLPTIRLARPRKRVEPLFPGYLFCHVAIPSVQWVEVRSLPGISYVLSAQGVPLPVPAELVEGVRVRADAESNVRAASRFKPGERVLIARGPFHGLEAAFENSLSSAGRSRVLLRVLSRLVPVEINDADLRRAT